MDALISDEVAVRLSSALMHFLWQGMVIVLLAGVGGVFILFALMALCYR